MLLAFSVEVRQVAGLHFEGPPLPLHSAVAARVRCGSCNEYCTGRGLPVYPLTPGHASPCIGFQACEVSVPLGVLKRCESSCVLAAASAVRVSWAAVQVPDCGHHHNFPRGQQVLLHAAGHLRRRAGDAGACLPPCFSGQEHWHIFCPAKFAAQACMRKQQEAHPYWVGACGRCCFCACGLHVESADLLSEPAALESCCRRPSQTASSMLGGSLSRSGSLVMVCRAAQDGSAGWPAGARGLTRMCM